MNLAEVFATTRAQQRAALIGYLPVGFPNVPGSTAAMAALVKSGTDIVEIGIPYSDPVMDGPTIQAAGEQALRAGARTADVFGAVEAVAAAGGAAVVMTYWNLVEQYGTERFLRDLASAGGSGVVTPDLIPDEAAEWMDLTDQFGFDRIFLTAPSSTPERLAIAAQACRGFVYASAVMGVTGARSAVSPVARELVARVREVTETPVAVGLGVSSGEQAREISSYADGVIVGSALVRCLLDAPTSADGLERLSRLTEELRAGL